MLSVQLPGFSLSMSPVTPRPPGPHLNNFLEGVENAVRFLTSPRTDTRAAEKRTLILRSFHLPWPSSLTGEGLKGSPQAVDEPCSKMWFITGGPSGTRAQVAEPFISIVICLVSSIRQSREPHGWRKGGSRESSPWAGREGTGIQRS